MVAEGVLFKVARVGTFVAHVPQSSFEFYLLLVGHVPNHEPILMQVQHGFEMQIAQLGGHSLVMSPEMALEQARQGALPPIAGVFRHSDNPQPKLMQLLGEIALQNGTGAVAEVSFRDRGDATGVADSVAFDNEAGGAQATRHLQKLGHKSIGFFGLHHSPAEPRWRWSKQREDGWRCAMERSGLETDGLCFGPDCELNEEPNSPQMMPSAVMARSAQPLLETLKTGNSPLALVAANDKLALQILQYLREAGLSANRWPSIIGFDNTPTDNGFLLSSLRLPWEHLAARAATLLWERRHSHSSSKSINEKCR